MNKTRKAHLDAIAHWKRLMLGKGRKDERPFSDNCPLCKLFLIGDGRPFCEGCPVSEATGMSECIGTPYGNAHKMWMAKGPDSTEFKKCAKKEHDFLVRILPQNPKKPKRHATKRKHRAIPKDS